MKYLINQNCPNFVAPAVMPDQTIKADFDFYDYLGGRYGVLFFFPLDFNYISWTELLSVQKRMARFASSNTQIIAISCDSYLVHQTWQKMPKENNGLGPLGFPIVSDMTRTISRSFDILVAEAMPEASTIIVDQDNKVVFQIRHDTAVGRNIDRTLAAIDAFQEENAPATSPVDQILLLEEKAAELRAMGFNIVAQSVDTDLSHPQWKRLPRNKSGKLKLSFPFLVSKHDWPENSGLTIAIREGLDFHSTGLLMPDGQLLFEYHTDRRIPRDFAEMLRIADAMEHHLKTGETTPWETP